MKTERQCKAIEKAYEDGYFAVDKGVPNPYSLGSQKDKWYAFNAGKEDRRRGFTFEPLKVQRKIKMTPGGRHGEIKNRGDYSSLRDSGGVRTEQPSDA